MESMKCFSKIEPATENEMVFELDLEDFERQFVILNEYGRTYKIINIISEKNFMK